MAHMRNTNDPDVAAPRPARVTGPQAQSVGDDPALRQRSPDEPETSSNPAPPRFLQTPGRWQRWTRRTGRERRPFGLALLLSLLVHVLVLSLTFGGDTLGVPGLAAPWQEQRIEVPDLRVVLVPAQVPSAAPADKAAAEPSQQVTIDPPVAGGPSPTLPVSPALPPRAKAVANAPEAEPTAQADAPRDAVASVAPVEAPARATEPERVALVPVPEPARAEVVPAEEPSAVVLTAPTSPTSVIAVAPSASSPQALPSASQGSGDVAREAQREEAARQEATRVEALRLQTERQDAARQVAARQEAQREEAARQEEARVEAARLEAERQNAARQVAAQLEAQQLEAARQEAARVEAARLETDRQNAARQAAAQLAAQREEAVRQEAARVEAMRLQVERQETARQAAARLEVQRQEEARSEAGRLETERQNVARQAATQLEAQREEAARQAAARLEAQRLELARQEAARVEAARQEAARQATAVKEAARVEAEKDEAKREAVLRAIGRQLDEEAARRDAASKAAQLPNTLPYSLSTARRVRLWGRSDPNVELVQYAEAWARKIQFNTPVDTVRELAKMPHAPPMVSVAVRSDGSVESVTFVLTSGVAEVDEAIRRIVESHKPYPPFPPALARQFDVVEIRRTWSFDSAIRLQ